MENELQGILSFYLLQAYPSQYKKTNDCKFPVTQALVLKFQQQFPHLQLFLKGVQAIKIEKKPKPVEEFYQETNLNDIGIISEDINLELKGHTIKIKTGSNANQSQNAEKIIKTSYIDNHKLQLTTSWMDPLNQCKKRRILFAKPGKTVLDVKRKVKIEIEKRKLLNNETNEDIFKQFVFEVFIIFNKLIFRISSIDYGNT